MFGGLIRSNRPFQQSVIGIRRIDQHQDASPRDDPEPDVQEVSRISESWGKAHCCIPSSEPVVQVSLYRFGWGPARKLP